ncbi:glyoxylate reductase/hydroxypyruvate reductase-like [Babylonia areolata]|uniref:glyoxylate reductase/hydroxypyruvate reductase-like n=1 Tax=Babylonia areolata TaxID=304850 RepID=UPI003FD1B3DE
MGKYKVYVTRFIPKPGPEFLEKNDCDLTYWESDEAIPHEELVKNLGAEKYDALLCMLTDKINSEVLDAAGPQLQIVATMSVGYEHIDLDECKKRKITVSNTPGVSTDSVAELTVTMLLFVARRVKEGIRAVRNGQLREWRPTWLAGHQLSNSVVGIFGLGRIGYGVAKRILPFAPSKILYHDVVETSFAKDVQAIYCKELEDMLMQLDFLCICCNLTPQTRHRLCMATFSIMKNTAIIVNTGRGGVINHEELVVALENGVIGGAAVDVTEPEPLPKDHPLVHLNNCAVTPHMGSNTWDSRNQMSLLAAECIISVFNKEKPKGMVA